MWRWGWRRENQYTKKATIIKPNYLHTGRKTVLLSLLHSTEAAAAATTITMKWFKRLRITFGVPFLFLITSIYWARVPDYSISSFCQFLNKLIIVVSSSAFFFPMNFCNLARKTKGSCKRYNDGCFLGKNWAQVVTLWGENKSKVVIKNIKSKISF